MRTLAFLTQHDKLPAVAPALAQAGFELIQATGVDTDTLGTFTGEISRKTSQLQAALAKAKLATELCQTRFGLGSEGSFGPDPFMGVSAWGIEILALWDSQDQHVVHAVAQGPQTNYEQTTVRSWQEAKTFANLVGFPAHGVVVGKYDDPFFNKSITTWETLEHQFAAASQHGPVWLETDMRAYRNPTRMAMISLAAQALVKNLSSLCPQCATPGFTAHSLVPGALCSDCHQPTQSARAKLLKCEKCGFTLEEVLQREIAPDKCEHCNT